MHRGFDQIQSVPKKALTFYLGHYRRSIVSNRAGACDVRRPRTVLRRKRGNEPVKWTRTRFEPRSLEPARYALTKTDFFLIFSTSSVLNSGVFPTASDRFAYLLVANCARGQMGCGEFELIRVRRCDLNKRRGLTPSLTNNTHRSCMNLDGCVIRRVKINCDASTSFLT